MSLLQNAIYSIEAGIEDFQQGSEKRNISAVRNVFAGILLLFKEKLFRLAPEYDKTILIKKIVMPIRTGEGEIKFEGTGEKTVDVYEIRQRFNSLKIQIDWKRFEEINKLRNEVEHFYTDRPSDKIREILAKSFLVIRDFLVNELDVTPSEIIDRDCWSALLAIEELYSVEKMACQKSLSDVEWKYSTIRDGLSHIRCCICDSELVKHKETTSISTKLICAACGEEVEAEFYMESLVRGHLYADAYIAMTDGGEPPYDTCPECDRETFVFSEGACVACDYCPEYHECARCHEGLSLEEQDMGGLCSYCSYLAQKIMAE